MSNMHDVVERHIRDSALQLRRIDESLARARQNSMATAQQMQTLLVDIQSVRDRLVQELDNLHRVSSANQTEATTQPAVGAKSIFGSVGLQFENALAAVFETPRR